MNSVWVVRAGDDIKHQEFALENGCVVINFPVMGDMTSMAQFGQVRQEYASNCGEGYNNQQIGNAAGQCYRFAHRIVVGDYVIMPHKEKQPSGRLIRTGYVSIGKVTGEYRYESDAPVGCKHQRGVKWERREFPLGELPEKASLSSHLTVFEVGGTHVFRDLESTLGRVGVDGAIQEESPSADESTDTDDAVFDEANIRGYIRHNFQGKELEKLVAKILEAMGYRCELTRASHDGGIDIYAYHRDIVDSFGVEVKNTDAQKGASALRQFSGALQNKNFPKGLFVSWSGFGSKETEKRFRQDYAHIHLWNADDVMRLIEKHYDNFDEEAKGWLPLKKRWVLNLGDSANDLED